MVSTSLTVAAKMIALSALLVVKDVTTQAIAKNAKTSTLKIMASAIVL